VDRWRQLHGRLDAINQQEMYPAVQVGKRLETVISWRDNVLPIVDRFQKVDIPATRQEARQDAAEALTRIRAGRPLREPQQGKPEIDWSSVFGTANQQPPEPNRDILGAIQSMRDELLLQTRIQTAVTLHQLASTERLAGIVAGGRGGPG
jgi:hypothetical protein